MALNKYMHPRNIYKTPPDFGVLLKLSPEFSKIAKTDITGKITIDFKDPHSLRILTKSLLQCDFNLDVDIPEDRLVPTLPLRLNYILWIEDLLISIKRENHILGLDIGTGSCAIYPLLAAVKNKWHMIGTEQDRESLLKAEENVKNNNLGEFIRIKKNQGESIIEHILSDESSPTFDFCMCNPPFYSSVQELCESRSPARPPPKNGFTGSPQELITEGGELHFCRKLIKESKSYKKKIIIFTTMVGHKYNLSELIQDLKADGIKYTHTEFCQGRVTRWGLAWTYHDFDIYKLVSPREKTRKQKEPLIYILPKIQDSITNLETACTKIKMILRDLEITYNIIEKRGNNLSIDIIARKNTWSNQRRKRRLLKRMEAENNKKSKVDDVENNISNKYCMNKSTEENINITVKNSPPSTSNEVKNSKKNNIDDVDNINNNHSMNDLIQANIITALNNSPLSTSNEAVNSKKSRIDDVDNINNDHSTNGSFEANVTASLNNSPASSTSKESTKSIVDQKKNLSNEFEKSQPLVHALLRLLIKETNILLEIEFLDGSAGKDGLHQIIQYIKNNWN